jgi:hypothetical protein
MTGLHIIKGKAVLAANLMAAAIKRAGKYDYRAACTDTDCSIVFFGRSPENKWEEIGTTTFSMDDAKRAQLGGDNWRKWPKAMLFARCISSGYKQHCPDALGAAPVYVEAHGETEITEEAPKARAALAAPAAPTIDAEASVVEDVSKPVRKRTAKQEANPAPETPKAADGYPDEYEGQFEILRVVRRPGKPIAINAAGEHGVVWIATSVAEYGDLAEANLIGGMRLEIARIGQTLQVMRVIGPIAPAKVDPADVPF